MLTAIAEATVPLYKPPNPIRRVWAAIASAGLGVVIGIELPGTAFFEIGCPDPDGLVQEFLFVLDFLDASILYEHSHRFG